jgi:hypothetical protein
MEESHVTICTSQVEPFLTKCVPQYTSVLGFASVAIAILPAVIPIFDDRPDPDMVPDPGSGVFCRKLVTFDPAHVTWRPVRDGARLGIVDHLA